VSSESRVFDVSRHGWIMNAVGLGWLLYIVVFWRGGDLFVYRAGFILFLFSFILFRLGFILALGLFGNETSFSTLEFYLGPFFALFLLQFYFRFYFVLSFFCYSFILGFILF
jgi:hypothetical protein